jgi:Tfp pilus assembly protein PilV
LHRLESGFTLAEIAVALGIFSFALVSMMGMLSVGLKNSRKATVQTSASNLLSGIVADIHASTQLPLGDDKFSFTSPKLQLAATLDKKRNTVTVVPAARSLNESCTEVLPNAPEMMQRVYSVQFFPGTDGVSAIRVRVEWPTNRQPNTKPEGFLEALVPLPL